MHICFCCSVYSIVFVMIHHLQKNYCPAIKHLNAYAVLLPLFILCFFPDHKFELSSKFVICSLHLFCIYNMADLKWKNQIFCFLVNMIITFFTMIVPPIDIFHHFWVPLSMICFQAIGEPVLRYFNVIQAKCAEKLKDKIIPLCFSDFFYFQFFKKKVFFAYIWDSLPPIFCSKNLPQVLGTRICRITVPPSSVVPSSTIWSSILSSTPNLIYRVQKTVFRETLLVGNQK